MNLTRHALMLAIVSFVNPALAQPPAQTAARIPLSLDTFNNAKPADTGSKDGISPAVLRAEVMLDRLHISPGVIDGRGGDNFEHALEIYEKKRDF